MYQWRPEWCGHSKNASVRHDSRGDTIVEVLIATAVVAMVLVGSYAITTHSTSAVQDSQEHQEATSLVNRQLELLRSHSGLDTSANECFNDTAAPASGAGCKYSYQGASNCNTASESRCYTVTITASNGSYNPATDPLIPVTYKVRVTWDSLLNNTGSVSMVYGLPKDNPAYSPPAFGGGAGGGAGAGDSADLGSTSCTDTGSCGASGNSVYHYTISLTVKSSTVPVGNIQSCTWDWGDGSVDTYTPATGPCEVGEHDTHVYMSAAERAALPPYPAACPLGSVSGAGGQGRNYNVKFTIHTTAGSTVSTNWSPYLPACWP